MAGTRTKARVKGISFARKPLTVEALQLVDADQPEDVLSFIGEGAQRAYVRPDGVLTVEPGHEPCVIFKDPVGRGAIAKDGDWIIKTGDGFWHATEADFLRDYEEA